MRPLLPACTVTAAAAEELPQDPSDSSPLDRELDRIRQRRTGQTGFFRGTFDDWTLVFGVIAGAIFFGGMMVGAVDAGVGWLRVAAASGRRATRVASRWPPKCAGE